MPQRLANSDRAHRRQSLAVSGKERSTAINAFKKRVWTLCSFGDCGYHSFKHKEEEEEGGSLTNSLILMGNWSLPTVHMGDGTHPIYEVIPISVVGRVLRRGGGQPTTKMG